jgi:hypothetical protein
MNYFQLLLSWIQFLIEFKKESSNKKKFERGIKQGSLQLYNSRIKR